MRWFELEGNKISLDHRIDVLKLFCKKIGTSEAGLLKKLKEKEISKIFIQVNRLLVCKGEALPSMLKSGIKIYDQDIKYMQNKIESMKDYQYAIEEIYIDEKMIKNNKNIASKIESDLKKILINSVIMSQVEISIKNIWWRSRICYKFKLYIY